MVQLLKKDQIKESYSKRLGYISLTISSLILLTLSLNALGHRKKRLPMEDVVLQVAYGDRKTSFFIERKGGENTLLYKDSYGASRQITLNKKNHTYLRKEFGKIRAQSKKMERAALRRCPRRQIWLRLNQGKSKYRVMKYCLGTVTGNGKKLTAIANGLSLLL